MIELTVDFALWLLDEFNGAVLEDRGILFSVNRRLTNPIRKPDGYYVFHGMEGEAFEVDIFAPLYQAHRIRVERARLNPVNPVVTLRLFRAKSGTFRDCEWVDGIFRAGRTVYIFQERDPPLRLQSESWQENGCTVLPLGYMLQRRVGRRFAVGCGEALETFVITGKSGSPGAYITDAAFAFPHRQGEPVLRAYASRCGPEGDYHIPVEHGFGEGVHKIWHRNERESIWECV